MTTIAPLLALCVALGPATMLPSDEPTLELVVRPETPLRIALDERVRLRHAGQIVTGTLVAPVYAYDRVVAPVGTRVFGHVSKLTRISRGRRLRAMANGDFTPLRDAVLEFDLLVLEDGREIPVETEVRSAAPSSVLRVRETPGKKKTAPAEAAPARKRPGKMRRLREWLVDRLPYHPQYLAAGTVHTAVLLEPLSFGTVEPTEQAPAGTLPPPDSVLHARLVTALDSSRTPRGSAVRAVVTEPLFSEDHRLILPEGAVLGGEVTFARPAGRFHKNGQLRFLFETVQAPDEESPEGLQASLRAVEGDPRLALDDEGGARMTRSKTRFVAPALAGLALGFSLHRRWDYDTDGLGPEAQYGTAESKGLGGFFGAGLIGAGLSQASRPVSVGFGIAGLARTLFLSVAGRGRDVSFPAHTPIEVELATAADPAR